MPTIVAIQKEVIVFDRESFVHQINTQGYSIVEHVLTDDYIVKAKSDLEDAIRLENEYHAGKDHHDYGMVLLCSLYGRTLIDLFANTNLTEPFNVILGDGCIVYAYTSSSMPPTAQNYSARIHVDCPRIIPGYVTNMGATILLDDFTAENGATWFLPYSQTWPDAPSEEEFYGQARRVIARAGSVFFFNARLWHAGGANHTDQWRHALTVNMCRAYMKQRLDIPRAMQHMALSGVSEAALQKLGFLAQVPASYDEYYAPFEERKYKQKTE
jgi:ectoine hydroxylase-related dioxygenase (phytanoyl-CoA dioxygenase family)